MSGFIRKNSKKPKIERDGYFPSFSSLVKQERNIDEELRNLADSLENLSVTTIELPILGLNKLQDRFHVQNKKVPVITRNYHKKIMDALNNAYEQKNASRGLYIHGPSGLGKSYALYHVVSILRLQSDKCRVTYINSCEEWWKSHQDEPYKYMLNVLISTFNNDSLKPLTIADWAEFVMMGPTADIIDKLNEDESENYNVNVNQIKILFNQLNLTGSIKAIR